MNEEIRPVLDYDISDRQRFLYPFTNVTIITTTTPFPIRTFKSTTVTTTTTTTTKLLISTTTEVTTTTSTTTTLIPFWLRVRTTEEATIQPLSSSWTSVDNLKLYRSKKVEEPNTYHGLITPLIWRYEENFFIKKYAA